jgi:hypothetical protein
VNTRSLSVLLTAVALLACGKSPTPPVAQLASGTGAADIQPPAPDAAADAFLRRLAQHCGEAFEGRVISNTPPQEHDAFDGQRLVMHVRECSAQEVRVPLHVGDDHSRTWILTRTDTGLRLQHDHRHADGSDDDVTMYGGDTATPGTAVRQEFPVDDFSIEMFLREDLPASISNVWALEIQPGERFVYELSRRAEERLFQVEFDLTTPVAPPPTPWGHPVLPGDG